MIQRYKYDEGDGNWRFPGHVHHAKGTWVKYEDHQRVVNELRIENEQLKEERNKAFLRGTLEAQQRKS